MYMTTASPPVLRLCHAGGQRVMDECVRQLGFVRAAELTFPCVVLLAACYRLPWCLEFAFCPVHATPLTVPQLACQPAWQGMPICTQYMAIVCTACC